MQHLSESTQLLYSELLSECLSSDISRGRGLSFVKKKINGKNYWYLQIVVGSSKRQHHIGAETKEILSFIQKQKKSWEQAKPDLENRERLVAMLISGGATSVTTTEARLFELLQEARLFKAGCLLIGSHAFSTYANMLGVKWDSNAMRTQDVDVVGSDIDLLTKEKSKKLSEVFDNSELEFLEVPALNRKAPTTSYKISGRELKIDLLTPLMGRPSSEPVFVKALNSYADPLRFLDYIIEDSVPAVVVAKSGILVNVPTPARFALHKLVVSQRRSTAFALKSKKDIKQAELLIEVLLDTRPGDLQLAWDGVENMPNKFKQQLLQGLDLVNPVIRKAFSDKLKLDR